MGIPNQQPAGLNPRLRPKRELVVVDEVPEDAR